MANKIIQAILISETSVSENTDPVLFFKSIDDSLGTYSIVSADTDATVIDESVIHEWLSYASGLDAAYQFRAADAPSPEACPNGAPSPKTIPPHP